MAPVAAAAARSSPLRPGSRAPPTGRPSAAAPVVPSPMSPPTPTPTPASRSTTPATANASTKKANTDTDPTPWCTIGGTSLASPLIASVFALAGGATASNTPPRPCTKMSSKTRPRCTTSLRLQRRMRRELPPCKARRRPLRLHVDCGRRPICNARPLPAKAGTTTAPPGSAPPTGSPPSSPHEQPSERTTKSDVKRQSVSGSEGNGTSGSGRTKQSRATTAAGPAVATRTTTARAALHHRQQVQLSVAAQRAPPSATPPPAAAKPTDQAHRLRPHPDRAPRAGPSPGRRSPRWPSPSPSAPPRACAPRSPSSSGYMDTTAGCPCRERSRSARPRDTTGGI